MKKPITQAPGIVIGASMNRTTVCAVEKPQAYLRSPRTHTRIMYVRPTLTLSREYGDCGSNLTRDNTAMVVMTPQARA